MITIQGWKTYSFKEIASLSKEKYNPKKETLNLPCIELEHIESETGRLLGHTNSLSQGSIKNRFKPGDVLYGKLRPYLKKYYFPDFEGVCSSEIWVLRNQKGKIRNKYLYYLVQTNRFNKSANISIGTKMPRADWNFVSETIFPIPTLKEQDKIISVLSTWDKAIKLKEKLIEQKKKQKKGLMQKLLTGEVRLPGFEGEWKVVQIGDLSKVVTGNTPSTQNVEFYDNGTIPWITPTDISESKYISDSERKLTEKGLDNGRLIPKGSLLVTCIASIGKNAILTRNGSCNQQINAIFPSDKHSNEFLYYKLELEVKKMEMLAGKTSTPIINKSTFEKYKIKIPEFNEQRAIAEVLSEFDRNIELLINEIKQLKLQKKGLMQLLLTGKVRVKV
mgnify:CR=1 FL=1